MIKKNNEMPMELTTLKTNMEKSESVLSNSEDTEENNPEDEFSKNVVESTTSAHVFTNKIVDQNEDTINNLNQNYMESTITTSTQPSNDNIINASESQGSQSISFNENQETEATTADMDTMGSMNRQNKDMQNDKNLINVLEKTTMSSQISNDNENKEITFDTINMLYNRSSKAILVKENSMEDITESNEVLRESAETSTDSDWLSESVTEVSLGDIANNNDNSESTEPPASKIDAIMNRGFAKDDFEPDYLNNMGSNNSKVLDQDEMLYGMSKDYENDDSRIKRINTQKDESEKSLETATLNSNTFETTTVGQYIYKMAEKTINEPSMTPETSTTTPRPAPVWEETENGPIIDQMSKSEVDHSPFETTNVMTSTVPTTTATLNKQDMDQDNLPKMADMSTQNTTKVNNLNVTIYEINQNDNQSFITSKSTNAQSSEFVDHETDMNPFLPEVENNKSLVKKLQEGHDIEPTNLNETQNENGEDHNMNNSGVPSTNESNMSPAKDTAEENDLSVISAPTTTTTANIDNIFDKLFTNSNSRVEDSFSTATEINKPSTNPFNSYNEEQSSEKSGSKEVLPISTFLLDTDDLDTTKRPTASPENDLSKEAESTNSKAIKDIDNEFLSVVPIEQENNNELKKKINSESIQELNYISDSPKKSDRRTDVNNFDSVLNYEA